LDDRLLKIHHLPHFILSPKTILHLNNFGNLNRISRLAAEQASIHYISPWKDLTEA